MSPSGTHVTPASVAELKRVGISGSPSAWTGARQRCTTGSTGAGAFEQATASLAYAREGGLPFQINTTVTQHNRHDLAQMLRWR